MTTPIPQFTDLKFCYPWRAYQASVLAGLDTHLTDNKLHVVAAPGAGKTVLGLEVMRRIGQPTLVLAPSLAIRNQWTERLVELFVPDKTRPDWISTDLKTPKLFTVATYQALHTNCDVERLKSAGIRTLIVDEAHHLRRAWWEALQDVTETLEMQIVALTATPPYDVASAEWRRYESFCGPVDAEISIPELVKTDDLAPHQDLIHLSMPDEVEAKNLNQLTQAAANIYSRLRGDPELITQLLAHDWIMQTRENTSDILGQPDLFSAMLIYLADADAEIPEYGLRVLGVTQAELPSLDTDWLEKLLEGLLDDLPEDIMSALRKARVLHNRKIKLDPLARQHLILERSRGKLESVAEIVRHEGEALDDALRLLVLTDFIREELLPKDGEVLELRQLAVASIFETLRGDRADIGVLTGSLLIIPTGCLSGVGITTHPMPHDPRYERVNLSGLAEERRVELLSTLFAAGHIRVMIGTRALLGQGWDMPALNTLVLASKVGSFVSSNQMRGRAIRKDPANPDKAANIWHLATVAGDDYGPEFALLERRFDTFQGLNVGTGQITSGLPDFVPTLGQVETLNENALKQMAERDQLSERWQAALITGSINPRMRRRLETSNLPRRIVQTGVALNAGLRTTVVALPLGAWALLEGPLLLGGGIAVAGAYILHPLLRDIRNLINHGTLAGSLQQVGQAVLYGLIETGLIDTDPATLSVQTGECGDGFTYCDLEGGTLKDETRFLNAMNDLLGPIENPRYLLIRESYLGKRLRMSPYPIPDELARKKNIAQSFQTGWRRHVGPAKLVYTRTVGGRGTLLQARNIARVQGRVTRQKSVWE